MTCSERVETWRCTFLTWFTKTSELRELDSYAEAIGTYSEAKNLSKTFQESEYPGKVNKKLIATGCLNNLKANIANASG